MVASTQTEKRLREAESIIRQAIPILGLYRRGFSQEALIRACVFVGDDPEAWTAHPDVMERRREILPKRFQKKVVS